MSNNAYGYPLSTQVVAYTTTTATGSGVGAQTYCVRLIATTACHIAFGGSGVTATTSDTYLAAGREEYFNIHPGQYVAAVQNASGGNLYVTEITR